jgi:2-methylcitrate dehydratase PrpD
MARVRYEVDESLQVKDMPARISVTLTSGERFEHRVEQVRGDARRPIPRAELLEKFHENAAGLDEDTRRWIADRLLAFEEVSRLEEVMDALSRPATVSAR